MNNAFLVQNICRHLLIQEGVQSTQTKLKRIGMNGIRTNTSKHESIIVDAVKN